MRISWGHCDSIIKVLLYEKIQRFVNKFESNLFKVSCLNEAFLFIFYLFFILLFFPKLQPEYKQNTV